MRKKDTVKTNPCLKMNPSEIELGPSEIELDKISAEFVRYLDRKNSYWNFFSTNNPKEKELLFTATVDEIFGRLGGVIDSDTWNWVSSRDYAEHAIKLMHSWGVERVCYSLKGVGLTPDGTKQIINELVSNNTKKFITEQLKKEGIIMRAEKNAKSKLESKLSITKTKLQEALTEYREALDEDPDLADDATFCQRSAKMIDALQRDESKYSQMLQLYDQTAIPAEPRKGAVDMMAKNGMGGIKDVIVRAAKQGVAVATVKTISNQAMVALGDKCPIMLQMLPEPLRDAALCALVFMAAEAYPNVPMSAEASSVSLMALEGITARTFAEATEAIAENIVPLFQKIAALGCGSKKLVEGA